MFIDAPSTIEDVVVVVHDEEIDLFKLQLRTFETFLEPCNLHYIINETNPKRFKKETKRQVGNSTKHNIRFWTREQILKCHPDVPGWSTQQLLKLLIPLKKDWIVFDTKDLLIRPVQLVELDKLQRKNYEDLSLNDPQGEFYQGLVELTEKGLLEGEVDPKKINMNTTPRVIDNRVIRKICQTFKSEKNFIDWFCKFKVQGEFIMHDYIAQSMNLTPKLRFTLDFMVNIWRQKHFDVLEFDQIPSKTKIFKCHRRVYNVKENKEKVDAWIDNVIKTYINYENALKGH